MMAAFHWFDHVHLGRDDGLIPQVAQAGPIVEAQAFRDPHHLIRAVQAFQVDQCARTVLRIGRGPAFAFFVIVLVIIDRLMTGKLAP